MQFFLYEIVARIIAVYLLVNSCRIVRTGLVERKVAYRSADFINLFIDWSKYVVHRDAAPFRYWTGIGLQIIRLVACLVVAIFGWWQPDT